MNSTSTGTYLFVYGLLRKNIDADMAHLLSSNSTFMGEGFVWGKLYDLGNYPGAILDNSSGEKVFGDLYLLHTTDILKELDDFEEIGDCYEKPHRYVRRETRCFLEHGEIKCWIYEYQWSTEGMKHIPAGDYIKYLEGNKFG